MVIQDKQVLNTVLRTKASDALLDLLTGLRVRGAVAGKSGLVLYDRSVEAPKEVLVMVWNSYLTLPQLISRIVLSDPKHFSTDKTAGNSKRLIYQAREHKFLGNSKCSIRILFAKETLPTLLSNCKIIRRNRLPVLPLSIILLLQLKSWAKKYGNHEGGIKAEARALKDCVEAILNPTREWCLQNFDAALPYFPDALKQLDLLEEYLSESMEKWDSEKLATVRKYLTPVFEKLESESESPSL
ncbi:hypothetical protein EST38_g7673 [Candolleomyces aberdarensis]|uniref:Uncharacterized protein n=1 Tax=Candolleomyces aberdarensis TaxID=2316362 RepID=A0A4Q2DGS6_9AGAR|nr:hypothetical protein EST38_g7673 [Candolleomyces aberdarensis]